MRSAEAALAVLDGLPGLVALWDRDLRNVLANRAYQDYFGYAPEAMPGLHIREVLGEKLFQANRSYMELALQGEEQLFDRTLVDQQGRTRHTQASYVPHIVDGKVEGFFVLVTDMTDRVEAEQTLRRSAKQYRALAASIPGGFVLLFDSQLRFQIAEGSELASFGYRPQDLEGKTVSEAFDPGLAADLEPRYRRALGGELTVWTQRVRDRVFSLRAAPVADADGTVFAGMVIAQDVTVQHRAEALQAALREIATAVARAEPIDRVSAQIANSLTAIFNADTAAVVKFSDPDHGEIISMAPVQPDTVSASLTFGPEDWSATAQVAKTGLPALVGYRQQDAGLVGALRAEGLVAGAAAPIRHQGQLWGAIALAAHEADQLTSEVLEQLAKFAELVELTLTNLTAWSTLTAQAATDPLTGLSNRRALDDHLAREQETARLTHEPLSVIAMDLDHFKEVNDTHGHAVGDRVLTEVAAILTSVARKSEILARIGGEEFLWVLPRTDTASATLAAERARAAIAGHHFDEVGRVTLSCGVCSTDDVENPQLLLAEADAALYAAKQAGRNQVVAHRSRPH
ncbi:PAS domain S-box-containing protein/diguanylate cyclase (GGDEF) domain-containing protein [Nakamurella panacisegetis]|uniref:PAS domain S-box-containing protein/diguanylate cyclase (GGDEF) domain-containing protein n=1 Tax=Nakamurella panacisegetis TaxID=1090615 RepID=A0A1H0N7Q5_9ACTN|nr:PAS domain S-box-containing protein/diguanylate cyclase (GGDEF) domain-containing protein [Nakamurella panacisegetis]